MKKRFIVYCIAAMIVLLGDDMVTAKEKGKVKGEATSVKKVAKKEQLVEQKKPSKELQKKPSKEPQKQPSKKQQTKPSKQPQKKITSETEKLAQAKKAMQSQLAPWKQIRKIALKEKATKTVAAIDKIIAEKEQQYKKKLAAMKQDTPKAKVKGSPDQKPPQKKKPKSKD